MIRLVKESLNEFGKGNDPLKTMGLGKISEIREFFRSLNISDDNYLVNNETGKIHYLDNLNLDNTNITYLPDNLHISGFLSLEDNMDLTNLPENLTVAGSIYLGSTNITELPEGTNIMQNIYLYKSQVELKTWLKKSIYYGQILFY